MVRSSGWTRIATRSVAIAALVAASLAASAAPVKKAAGPRALSASEAMLLSNRSVQRELKMTSAQVKRLMESQRAAYRSVGMPVGPAVSGRPAPRLDMRDLAFVARAQAKTATKTLTKAQKVRLAQIGLQVEGPAALARPDVARKLHLTPAQNVRIQSIERTAGQRIVAALRSAGPAQTPAARQHQWELVHSAETASTAEIMQVLSPAQRAKFAAMLGEPFTLTIDVGAPPHR